MWTKLRRSLQRPGKVLLTGFLVLLLFFGSGSVPGLRVHAGPSLDELEAQLENQEQHLEQLQQEIEAKKAGLEEAQEDRQALEGYIKRLESEIDIYEDKVYRLQSQIDSLDEELDITAENLQEAEEELAERTELAKRRVRALHESGTVSMLEVLVAANSFTDFLTRFSHLQDMLKQDVELLYQVRDERARIEAEKADLEKEREGVAALRKEAEGQLAAIASMRDNKVEELTRTAQQIQEIRDQLAELEEISNRIQAELQKLQKEYDEELRRRGISFTGLSWPLPRGGWISSPYGQRFHPILKQWKMHTGVDVAIRQGTPIYAAAAGKVVHAGWLGGYGNTVIIAHGIGRDGRSYSTLYAHAVKVNVSRDQYVQQGQQIATVGSTGYSTGPHLHFEVRLDGVHTNPLNYVSKP